MACRPCLLYIVLVLSAIAVSPSFPQSISTNTPLPPLQWINLTSALHGSPPPPLKDASIGYDDTSRTLLIFGGESEGGFVQSQTFLLNLDSLTWSTPSPPTNLHSTPSGRSAALGGADFAASNRHGHVIVGGKGSDGNPLSDVWEYDYNNQFWSKVTVSPGGPSARWGASGGIDIRAAAVSDPIVPGPNNTFFLAGGFDGTTSTTLSDVWRLHISGTLSSNLPDQVIASWDHQQIGNLPGKVNQASTMLSQRIISAGGCSTPLALNNSCAQSDSYVVDTQMNSAISPDACPAPRSSAVLVPNMNAFSSSFSSQVFLLLGTFNSSLWQDDNGLQQGEVAVLDTNTGSWSRVLPSGDPGSSGNPAFPSPREGAAAFSFSSALVGQSRSASSDTIIFGGRDTSGSYLSEVWLLRAYNSSINQSNQKWSGFADGQLQTGINANGAGVVMQYMTRCAIATQPNSFPPSPMSPASSVSAHPFDTSTTHKLLSPLSIALFLPAIMFYRLSSTQVRRKKLAFKFLVISAVIAGAAYVAGIVGLILAFMNISAASWSAKRSLTHNNSLKTAHGRAGLAFFVCFYGFLPFLFLLFACRSFPHAIDDKLCAESGSHDPMEKTSPSGVKTPTPALAQSTRNHSLLTRSQFWKSVDLCRRRGHESNETESVSSATTGPTTSQRGFEVVNRPARTRRTSGNSLANHLAADPSHSHRHVRSLGDVDWLERRRSLNAVGELDYVITQANRVQATSTPATTDALLGPIPSPVERPDMPPFHDIILRALFHSLALGLCVLSLVALWFRAPKVAFVVFLLWVLAFYISICVLAWCGKPQMSILATILFRIRAESPTNPLSDSIPDPLMSSDDSRGPYIHQPDHRTAEHDDASIPRSEDNHGEDDDEDTRQRKIEEEMERREVSIITVPKRKLWITNAT